MECNVPSQRDAEWDQWYSANYSFFDKPAEATTQVMESLKDQIAVVTGASSGIGKAIALSLASQRESNRFADPAAGSGHHSNLILETLHNLCCGLRGLAAKTVLCRIPSAQRNVASRRNVSRNQLIQSTGLTSSMREKKPSARVG